MLYEPHSNEITCLGLGDKYSHLAGEIEREMVRANMNALSSATKHSREFASFSKLCWDMPLEENSEGWGTGRILTGDFEISRNSSFANPPPNSTMGNQ
jgi:hypothetical protein